MKRSLWAIDTETFPIGPTSVVPKLVSVQFAHRPHGSNELVTDIIGNGDKHQESTIRKLLEDPKVDFTAHSAKFDFLVIARAYPKLLPLIFEAYAQSRIYCTIIREKLINLSWRGRLDMQENPDGSFLPTLYDLATLVLEYLGRDRSAEKKDADSWRNNFQMLDGKMGIKYPLAAKEYAIQDAIDHLLLWDAQQDRVKELGKPVSFNTQHEKAAVDFALYMMTERGVDTDEKLKQKIRDRMKIELDEGKMPLMIKAGILQPASPVMPFKNGAVGPDGVPRMKKAQKAKLKRKKLTEFVIHLCDLNGIGIQMNDPTNSNPKGTVSTRKGVIEDLVHLSPVLEEYQHRQALQKLVTTDLPRMAGKVIHCNFNVIVETGRTSSYADKLYPSANGQNPHPEIRPCYKARKGFVLSSTDISNMELCTLGQTNYELFGHSTHRDLINADIDLHAFLGASIAYRKHPAFQELCDKEKLKDKWDWYDAFQLCKDDEDPKTAKFYAMYRKLAKPVGLGYPGGLGPAKMIQFAKESYKVKVTLQEAEDFRDVWFETHPEMREYFRYINVKLADPQHPGLYCYDTPLGLHRAGATYCAAANGLGLQSPAAEGATLAVWQVARACYDTNVRSLLKGSYPLLFIHDEILAEHPDDRYAGERANEIARIMVETMQTITPDVTIRASSALMRRWRKEAKPVFDSKGRLMVWRPKFAA